MITEERDIKCVCEREKEIERDGVRETERKSK
jgi:hypothetical protein